MFDSALIDIAIGLSLVFLLFSLLVSAVSEMFASALKWRSTHLWKGIAKLLQSDEARNKVYNHPLIKGLSASLPIVAMPDFQAGKYGPSYIPSKTFALALLDTFREPHKLAGELQRRVDAAVSKLTADPTTALAEIEAAIRSTLADKGLPEGLKAQLEALHQQFFSGGNNPIDTEALHRAISQFAAALVTAKIAELGAMAPDLQRSLNTLMTDAAGNVDRFRENIEIWFNDGMDRVSGLYKRHTMKWQFGIAAAVAVLLNVDALLIARALWREPTLRKAIAAQGASFSAAPPAFVTQPPSAPAPAAAPQQPSVTHAAAVPTADQRFDLVQRQLSELRLPIGWSCGRDDTPRTSSLRTLPFWCGGGAFGGGGWWSLLEIPAVLLGWLWTAAAASLGAPFWFDLLKRVVAIRSAGKAPEERPLPPKEVPQPREPGQRPIEADLLKSLGG